MAPHGAHVKATSRLEHSQWIRRRSDYQLVQSSGKRFRQDHLIMLYMPSSSLLPRFGITVSRRVGNAVVRNRVKRWIREVLRQRGSAIAGAWDVVIIARPSARSAGLLRIERDFQGFSSWISKKSR